jgi:mannose-6-phosphate isomerase-like protein (cupin superfamily)
VRIPLAALAERVPLAPDQEFRVVELGRDADTSHHVAAIRTAEKPHRHDHHDQLVVIARGTGRCGSATRRCRSARAASLYVPRGAVHAFTNESARARGSVRDLLAAVRRRGPRRSA